jgi:signal peptidase I
MKNEIMTELISWLKIIVTAVFISLVINYLILINATVPSGSMENSIMTGDRIMAFRHSYIFSTPERKDIVIFPFPDDNSILYVKRIIGLPGDTVSITNGTVYINGTALYDEFKKEPMHIVPPVSFEVPPYHYFMMGDNRNRSLDSRSWQDPFVYRGDIMGKVLFRYFRGFTWLG